MKFGPLSIIFIFFILFISTGCEHHGSTTVTILYTGDVLGELEPCG